MSETEEPHQKVLHARIPASLERDLKAKAASLGISVSNLVRHVLTNTVDLVEGILVDSANIAVSAQQLVSDQSARPRAGAAPAAAVAPVAPQILGWQELVLNVNALCTECNAILPKGCRAAIAVLSADGLRPTLCLACLGALSEAAPEQG